ncbi:hypothetical protein OG729_03400 [Streptomyces sp. NBC_00210]|uniref:hypothetical protein n=1 Tax=unclassified Streptomyces TaxID=2593676 RepID=UPI00324E2D9D
MALNTLPHSGHSADSTRAGRQGGAEPVVSLATRRVTAGTYYDRFAPVPSSPGEGPRRRDRRTAAQDSSK